MGALLSREYQTLRSDGVDVAFTLDLPKDPTMAGLIATPEWTLRTPRRWITGDALTIV
jgi:hypothetical protein